MELSYRTPGKINLYLKVTRRRQDGYHELDTLFMPLPWLTDTVTVTAASRLAISSNNSALPTDHRNICYKAAKAYGAAANIRPDWHIYIEKKIPVAAGLGGGSSDAAAVLILLQRRYQALDKRKIVSLATQLGADVPFFLQPALSRARGIGEKLEPVSGDFPPVPLLIIHPRFPVSAAWAYNHLAAELLGEGEPQSVDKLLQAWQSSSWWKMGQLLHNDLGVAVMRKFPLLQILKEKLKKQGAGGVEISGSGPTLFAVFPSHEACEQARHKLSEIFPEVVTL